LPGTVVCNATRKFPLASVLGHQSPLRHVDVSRTARSEVEAALSNDGKCMATTSEYDLRMEGPSLDG
jgi:hypothetical protein